LDPQPPSEPFSVGKIVAVVLIPLAFLGVILFKACPRGDALGTIDVRAKGGTLAIEGASGDALGFRLDTKPGRIDRSLERSTISVELDENGKVTRSSCKAYAGAVMSTGRWGNSGSVLECRLAMTATGKASVRARAEWASGLQLDEAVLEVRKESSK